MNDKCDKINIAINLSKETNLIKDAIAKAGGVLTDGKSAHSNYMPSH